MASITPLMILMFALGTTGELFMPYRVEITNMQSYKNQSVKSLHRINPLWLRVVGGHQNIDGNYTPSLRAAQNVSWKSHMTNQRLNNALPRISTTFRNRRLALAGHVMRHNEEKSSCGNRTISAESVARHWPSRTLDMVSKL